ncbi:hypothetical protein WR25_14106 [Diploscapter pachys]|uniref:Vta1 C-terminal domain-containing protein n=1 Tax=Diploscapter pachys TaxID=2018661 RepID=A0A2A2KLI1_9BILA|nr:hypothetical protein WR25_14106 [Diploscapter pachys]
MTILGLMYAAQNAMKIDSKSPDALQFIKGLLSTLEQIKGQLKNMDAITNETVAQAHLENFALKLFNFADNKEKAGQVDKAVVHAFYTAGHVMDILTLFGELDEQIASARKYAKWKSTQIFACLKDGIPYVPSSQQPDEPHDELADLANFAGGGTSSGQALQPPASSHSSSSSSNFSPYPPNPTYGFSPQPPAPPTHSSSGSSIGSYGQNQNPQIPPPHRPTQPAPPANFSQPAAPVAVTGRPSDAEFAEAKKYIKFAMSSLDYEDTKSIVENLNKALGVLNKYTM